MTDAEESFMADLRLAMVKHEVLLHCRTEVAGMYKRGATEYRFFSPHGIELTLDTVQTELSQVAENAA